MKKLLLILSVLLFSISNFFAQWSDDPLINTPVSVATNWQIDLRMIEDDQGGAFIVWKDYRNGTPDIFAQHINSDGVALWLADGLPVCTQTADQSTPGVISDGAGGIIVSWSDWRSGIERDIYAQRISSSGQILWPLDGVVVVNKSNREHNQRMVMDNQGGAIVVFEQKNLSTYNWEIWAQRIDANGNAVWPVGGIPVTGVLSNHLNERIQSDGMGGVFVTFQDLRNGIDYDVYVQHLGPNGEYLWGTGVLACDFPGIQTNPKIDPDPSTGGVIVSWTDKRNGVDYDVYAQRINLEGALQWSSYGFPICNLPGNQSAIEVYANELVGGVIFVWKDNRNGMDYDIYVDKLNYEGISQWNSNGYPICTQPGNQLNPSVTGDGYGGVNIVWQDDFSGEYDVRAQRIYSNGQLEYTVNGVDVCTATGIQTSPKNISDEQGNVIIAWEDSRTGLPDIYCNRLVGSGPYIGVQDISKQNSINLFPNPATSMINIEVESNFIGEIQIYSSSGLLVGSQCISDGNNRVNIDTLDNGVYLIKVVSRFGSIEYKRFIKLQ